MKRYFHKVIIIWVTLVLSEQFPHGNVPLRYLQVPAK